MPRTMRGPKLSLCVLLISLILPAVAQVSQSSSTDGSVGNPATQQESPAAASPLPRNHRIVPWRDPSTSSGPVALAAPAGAHLSYFGGPVISNVHIVQVLYGSGSYNPQVGGAATPSMGNFYGDITSSGFITLLSQYSTTIAGGTNQTIGNGTFDGLFQIVPSAANNGSTISDTQIQSELLAQITAGHLPAPITDAAGNVNTLYMLFFPPGKKITLGGSSSCVAGGFCAYHGTTSNTFNSRHVLYGVHPDMQAGSGCAVGCGGSTTFNNYTSVTSHELAEAMTDADAGLANSLAFPLAWEDANNGEIGDICNAQQGQFLANGTTYTIQLEFSNAANNCVLPPATATPNFTLSASPASVSVTQGSRGSSTINVTPSGGFTGNVSLSVSGLPAGVTATFGTNPTTSSSVLSFTASSTATAGTSTVTVTGTSGSLTHTTTVSLTVTATATPNFSLSASPSNLTVTQGSSGSSTISVMPSGGFTGSVNLSASGLPSGVTASFGVNPTTSTSVVTFAASSTAATGTATVTITGVSGTLTHTTTISLTVNAAGGGAGTVTLSPASFNFGTIPANTGTGWVSFTLANSGTAAVSISGVTITGPFVDFSQCGSSLSAGTSCTIFVSFRPTATGTFTGTLTVNDNASNSPQTSSLSGVAN